MLDTTVPYSAIVGAAGTATITVKTARHQIWTITQVSVELTSAPIGATCKLKKNGSLITPLVATGDAATGDPPVILLPGDEMTIEWAGCTVGTTVRALVFYSYQERFSRAI